MNKRPPARDHVCSLTFFSDHSYCDSRSKGMMAYDVAGEVFRHYYLSGALLPGLDSRKWTIREQRWMTKIQRIPKGQEASLYTGDAPLLCLLNHISKRIFDAIHGQKALVFRSGNCKVKSPFTDRCHQPDIVVEWEEVQEFPYVDYSALSPDKTWTEIAAVGEVKVSQSGKDRLTSYLRNHLRFHPELNAVLGFTAQQTGYALVYHDAAVIHQSKFEWEAGPLYAFVGKLYTRPYRDRSMQISDAQAPTWTTKIGNDVYVSKAGTLEMLAGPGQRRQTGMWKNPVTDKVQAHHRGYLCGLVLHSAYGYVLDETHAPIRTTFLNPDSVKEQAAGRFKMRLVTEEIGSPLNGVHSLLKFLCTMYDSCVVQRNLYRKCRILHRDISKGNIMFAPGGEEYRKRNRGGYANVKFVNQVLARDENVEPEPACLVIDLGNGADLKTERSRDALTDCTGTPKFIARSVSSGRLLYSSKGVDMPLLDGPSAGYRQFMHTTEYQVAHSPGNPDTGNPDPAKVEFAHRLFHDAESTLWVIAWTLITSVKTGSKPESGLRRDFSEFFYTMRNHFPQPPYLDSRGALACFSVDPAYWETALHPDLAMLAPMLANMFRYILPEWAHRPDLDDEHVHEALMRLLLAEIVKIEDNGTDIEIDVGGRQPPPPPPGVNPFPHSASKSRSKDSTQSQTGHSTEPKTNKASCSTKKPSCSTKKIPNNEPDRSTRSVVLRSDTAAGARAEQQNEQQSEQRNEQRNEQQEVPLSWSMDTCELQEPEQEPEDVLGSELDALKL
ncbi:Nebulin-related-anchoring protein [Rhizoctonia solani]|uniref:Nebulin-related-anchoring protein n=1 Tax=Rhizoctonia solani TaxID=456999 RepID=A0A0K6FV10_9AGAM|nr:Nebulin-related-anchoring protein [Rhizoctonia solani]